MTETRKIVKAPRRFWCFTLNNPTCSAEDCQQKIMDACTDRFRYLVFQLEVGESNTPHYQGYLELTKTVRITWLVKNIFQAHWTPRYATRDAARIYCMKEPRISGPYECGEWELHPGKRTDLDAVSAMVKSGASAPAIADAYPNTWLRYSKGIRSLISVLQKPRTEVPTIILCYGKTGTGKTKWCYDNYPELYRKPCDTRWFDQYCGDDTLLLDDFGGASSKMSLLYLLQLLDRYAIQVEIKGDYVAMLATTIVITTNYHPKK